VRNTAAAHRPWAFDLVENGMPPKTVPRTLETDDTRLDVVRYLRMVWRRRLFVLIPVVFITSITMVGVRFMSPLYVSKTKLHVESRTRVNSELERRIVDEDKRVRRKDQLVEVRTQLMNRDFLEGIVRELGLQNDPTILAKAKLSHDNRTPDVPTEEIAMRTLVRGLRDKVQIQNAEDNTFVVSVQDNDPESAYILAKVISRDFLNAMKRERMDKLEELFKFSSQQQRIYREKVDDAERELRDFQAQLIREQNDGSPVNVANVGAARLQLKRMQLDVDQAERRTDAVRGALRQVFDPLPDLRAVRADREIAALERRLRSTFEDDTQAELDRARTASSTTTLPDVDTNGATRAALRHRLGQVIETQFTTVEPFYRDKLADYAYEQIDLDAQRAASTDLEQLIRGYTAKAEQQPEKELQLTALQERAATARTNLETFERTLQSAELSETMMTTELGGGVSIVDPPEKPIAPVKPNRTRLTGLALLLSLLGGLGTVFSLEYIDKSFKDVDEIEKILGLRVVGTIPRVATGMPWGGMPVNRKRNYMLASSVALLVFILGGMALYERLLRKQHITVPHARAEEILRGGDTAQPATTAVPATPTR
jgi:succinoglycan biosynthesis transport protein ExoP